MESKKPTPPIIPNKPTPKPQINIKGPIRYKFYCKICGTEIRTGKKHTQTCSATCRVTLSNIMRYGVEDASEDITAEQRKEIDLKVAHAKGENVSIPNPNEKPGIVARILNPSKGKKSEPPVDPNLVPVADPTTANPVNTNPPQPIVPPQPTTPSSTPISPPPVVPPTPPSA